MERSSVSSRSLPVYKDPTQNGKAKVRERLTEAERIGFLQGQLPL